MKLFLQRRVLTDESTIGDLYINGEKLCFVLEDKVRPDGVKIPGRTAIPAGTYNLIIRKSVRFGRMMVEITNVPGFVGVLIHWGNWAVDTEGCPLLGMTESKDKVGDSRIAYGKFWMRMLEELKTGEEMTIEIKNPEEA